MNPNHAKGYRVQKWNSILDLYVEVCLKINRLDCFIMVIWNRLQMPDILGLTSPLVNSAIVLRKLLKQQECASKMDISYIK